MTISQEADHLQGLMDDFPANDPPKMVLETALATLDSRYNQIYDHKEFFVDQLSTFDHNTFVETFETFPKRFHRTLYQDILSNAGEYRKISDEEEGNVWFGNNQKFRGVVPQSIEEELGKNSQLLIPNTRDPIKQGVQYYQRFVQIHPFYDANGRIARLILSIYLSYYDLDMDWNQLNNKWIKLLNASHKRYGGHNYNEYLLRLCKHWCKSITEIIMDKLIEIRQIMPYDMDDTYEIMRQLRGHHTLDSFKETFDAQKQSGYELFGAFDGMKLVGLIGMRPVLTLARGFFLHVDDLIVDETERGNGWGEQLMQFAADYAKEKGMVKIFLDARPEAIPFYEKLGYTPHTSPSMSIIL